MTPTKDPVSPERVAEAVERLSTATRDKGIAQGVQVWVRDVRTLLSTIDHLRGVVEAAQRENVHLRVIHQKVGCPYGHGSAQRGCALGYPGCACMDDLLATMAWGPEDEDKAAVRLGGRLKAAEARCAAMVEALEPFAAHAETFSEDEPDHMQDWPTFTAGDFRRAYRALKAVTPTTSDGDIGEASGDQVARPQTEAGEPVTPSEERRGMELAMGGPFCQACLAFAKHGYCNLAGCPMPRPVGAAQPSGEL